MSPRMIHEEREPYSPTIAALVAMSAILLLLVIGFIAWYLSSGREGAQTNVSVTTPESQTSPYTNVTPSQPPPSGGTQPGVTPGPPATPPATPPAGQQGGSSKAGQGAGPRQTTPKPPTVIVQVLMTSDDTFNPTNLSVPAGTTVKWVNKDTKTHTVISDKAGGPNSNKQFPNGIPEGQAYTWKVPSDEPSGTVWYYHDHLYGQPGEGNGTGSGMSGSITVQ